MSNMVGVPRLELGVTRSQSAHVSHYTTPRIYKTPIPKSHIPNKFGCLIAKFKIFLTFEYRLLDVVWNLALGVWDFFIMISHHEGFVTAFFSVT